MDEKEFQEIKRTLDFPNEAEVNGKKETFYMVSHEEFTALIAEVERLQEENETYKDLYTTQNTQNMQYRQEILHLRGTAHMGCPKCFEDCQGWIVDGKPCGDDW
jgi:adenylate cyclase class IV